MDFATFTFCVLIVIGTFLSCEFIAWFSHKYIMDGFLWSWHKSHHTVHDHSVERNDLFALLFCTPCIGLLYYATLVKYNVYLISMGIGTFCYGVFYLVCHDIIVHQRINWHPSKKSKYLRRIINADYGHPSKHTKEGCEAFGFLIVLKKYEPKTFAYKLKRQETQ